MTCSLKSHKSSLTCQINVDFVHHRYKDIDRWMHGWMDRKMDGWTNGRIDREIIREREREREIEMDIYIYRDTEIWRYIDRDIDKDTHIYIYRYIYIYIIYLQMYIYIYGYHGYFKVPLSATPGSLRPVQTWYLGGRGAEAEVGNEDVVSFFWGGESSKQRSASSV